jgi:hypothetical protein
MIMMQDHCPASQIRRSSINGTALPSLALENLPDCREVTSISRGYDREKAEETIAGAARYTDTGGHRKVHHPISLFSL